MKQVLYSNFSFFFFSHEYWISMTIFDYDLGKYCNKRCTVFRRVYYFSNRRREQDPSETQNEEVFDLWIFEVLSVENHRKLVKFIVSVRREILHDAPKYNCENLMSQIITYAKQRKPAVSEFSSI